MKHAAAILLALALAGGSCAPANAETRSTTLERAVFDRRSQTLNRPILVGPDGKRHAAALRSGIAWGGTHQVRWTILPEGWYYSFAPGKFKLYNSSGDFFNNYAELYFQPDGNLVLYTDTPRIRKTACASSGTYGRGVTEMRLESDGEVTLWRGKTFVWSNYAYGFAGKTHAIAVHEQYQRSRGAYAAFDDDTAKAGVAKYWKCPVR